MPLLSVWYMLDYASNITLAPQVMTYIFLYFISLNTEHYDFKRFGQSFINLLCQASQFSLFIFVPLIINCIVFGWSHVEPFTLSIHKDRRCRIVFSTIITYPIAGAGCFLWAWINDQMVVIGICVVGETESKLSSCPVHKIDLCSSLGGILT